MSEVTFKSAEPASEPQVSANTPEFKPPESVVVPSTATPKTTNIPIEQWSKENEGKPYSVKFFDTDTPFDFLPAEVQDKMRDIDRFVESEIADRGLKHTTFDYEQVLNDTMLELGITDGSLIEQVDRIHGFAQNILKLDGLDEIRTAIKAKLRKLQTSKDMNDLVLKEIGKKIL